MLFLLAHTTTLTVLAQSPYFIEDINPYITVYDSAEVSVLPPLNLGIFTYNGGLDTNFFSIVDPSKGFKRLLNYPYPNSQLQTGFNDLFTLGPVNNSNQWYTARINEAISTGGQPNDFESVSTLDSELNYTYSFSMAQPISYEYQGESYSTVIELDSHDKQAFELNGTIYFLTIGTHLESFDASNSWIGEDSMIVRFTTLHVIEASSGEEVARWTPQEQGYRIQDFGTVAHLRTAPNGIKRYSHPHINVINPYVRNDNTGVDIYASARHPGTITRLFWDGSSSTLTPVWMFGYPPHQSAPSIYLETETDNQLNAPHGSSAFERGDTTFVTTYNNKADVDSIGGRHQVWQVLNDTASLIWQSPDIGIRSICKGDSKWSADGRLILTTHGNCDGVQVISDGNGGTIESGTFEKFNIWNPWTNQKVLGMTFSGSLQVGLMDFIDENRILNFSPIEYTVSDSIHFTHPHSGIEYWTVGNDNYSSNELTLSLTYLDSLDEISAWIKTGITGVWRVDEKSSIITSNTNWNQQFEVSTTHCLDYNNLPTTYSWKAYDLLGQSLAVDEIKTAGIYVLEATDKQNKILHRAKHTFVSCY